MDYSALIFHPRPVEDIETLKTAIRQFSADKDCRQIVLSCPGETLLKLIYVPLPNVTLVRTSEHPYNAMVSGLAAVMEDNVLVTHLDKRLNKADIQLAKKALEQYPANAAESVESFDTRLLMFSLQQAIEQNLAVNNYMEVLDSLANTPVQVLNSPEK